MGADTTATKVWRKRRIALLVGFGLLVLPPLVLAAKLLYYRVRPVEAVIAEFLERDGVAEDQLIDPLVLAGSRVVPTLVERVRNPTMPRRLYALSAIGLLGDESHVAELDDVLLDPSNSNSLRLGAFRAIAALDCTRATSRIEVAATLGAHANLLEVVEQRGCEGVGSDRTVWQALIGYHE
jgi:hypothetical protein